jgi:hypothetical protein
LHDQGKPLPEKSDAKTGLSDAHEKADHDGQTTANQTKADEGEDGKLKEPEDGQLERFYTTMRIEREFKFEKLHNVAAAYWGFNKDNTELLDDTKQACPTKKSTKVAKFIESRLPMFFIFEKKTTAKSIKQTSGEDSKLL